MRVPAQAAALTARDQQQLGMRLQTNDAVNHLHALWATAAPCPDDFSRELWADCEPQRQAIFGLEFIKELAAGTLVELLPAVPRRQVSFHLAVPEGKADSPAVRAFTEWITTVAS